MLVGAFACAHTPQLLIRPPTEDRDLVLRVHAAFARVKERLAALRPDVIAIIAGDHIEAFFLDAVCDRQLLDRLQGGRGRELAAITGEELDKTGNVELRTWVTLLGAVGDARAQVYCYEPSWHHGNAVVEWPL